jgi:hypothetical protein
VYASLSPSSYLTTDLTLRSGWGTAAYYAYRAYGDKNLLNHTIANWNYVSKLCVSPIRHPVLNILTSVCSQITKAIASSGQMNGKSFTVQGSCGGGTSLGITCRHDAEFPLRLHGRRRVLASGEHRRVSQQRHHRVRDNLEHTMLLLTWSSLFMAMSAYLAQATGDSKYTTAAYAAGNWIKNANKNSAGLVLDTINGQDCTRSDPGWLFTCVSSVQRAT